MVVHLPHAAISTSGLVRRLGKRPSRRAIEACVYMSSSGFMGEEAWALVQPDAHAEGDAFSSSQQRRLFSSQQRRLFSSQQQRNGEAYEEEVRLYIYIYIYIYTQTLASDQPGIYIYIYVYLWYVPYIAYIAHISYMPSILYILYIG